MLLSYDPLNSSSVSSFQFLPKGRILSDGFPVVPLVVQAEVRRRPPRPEMRFRTECLATSFWKIVAGLALPSTCWHLVPVVTSERDEYLPIHRFIEFSRK
jgi:hypothetical protein